MDTNGKVALITGAASGLGAATARRFVAAGMRVVLVDRNRDGGAALAAELGEAAAFAVADVTSEPELTAAVGTARERFGALHVAVGCAGIGTATRTLSKSGPFPLDLFRLTIDVNLIGMFNTVRLAADAMQANEPGPDGERGVCIMTASIAAFDGQIGQAAYSASKGGIVGMTLPIARDLSKLGVRVVTIAPGLFDTPILQGLPAEARAALAASIPFPARLGDPPEYAALAQHIVENRMLNGETIRLDGALRMAPR
ncbi:MAG: SDR family NAD(P)-dependent oxidoreductase [Polyangiaceae bacterium]|nr:SDR family NAD(P)-dependent oxidoreductase [Polyangiaceae bacterium]